MRLKLLRLECEIEADANSVSTFQIINRHLFAKTIESLLSEQGEYAKEPYLLFDDEGKRISPRKRLLVVNALPELPTNSRTLLSRLYKRMVELSEVDGKTYDSLLQLSALLNENVESISSFLRGSYALDEWSLEAYLKAFAFSPPKSEEFTLLDKCIHLFELVADVAPEMPIIMVNAKTFFDDQELDELLSQAVFCGVRLILMESSRSEKCGCHEMITTIDEDFCSF